MKVILYLLLLSGAKGSFAQKKNSFSIKLNNKEIIKKQKAPETEPVQCTVKKTAFLTANTITITYTDKEALPDWHKVFIFNNEDDLEISREVQKTVSGTFIIKLRLPIGFIKGTMKILTLNEPNDPNQAALVRLRTFPLANIIIK